MRGREPWLPYFDIAAPRGIPVRRLVLGKTLEFYRERVGLPSGFSASYGVLHLNLHLPPGLPEPCGTNSIYMAICLVERDGGQAEIIVTQKLLRSI